MRKLILPLLLVSAVSIYSCQQEPNDIINQAQQCRISSAIYLGGGGMYDSANFTYDANGRVTRWESEEFYYTYHYTGNNITSRRYYDKATGEMIYVDSIRYNNDNTVSEILSHDYTQWMGDSSNGKFVLQYQNGKLNRTFSIEYYDLGWGIIADTTASHVYWDAAGNNIDRVVLVDEFGVGYDSIMYQYDTNPNYFKIVHPHFYLFDPEFGLHGGLEANLPYFYSRNNVTNSNMYGSWDYPIDYGLDSTNKITSLDMGGFEYYKYHYTCP